MGPKFWMTSKTMLFGMATAIAPAALTYAAGVDWTQFGISPMAGAVIGVTVMGLRAYTTRPLTTE